MMSLLLLLQVFPLWRASVPDELIRGRNFVQDFFWQEAMEKVFGWGEGTGLKMREAEFYRCQLQEKSRSGLSFVSYEVFYFTSSGIFSLKFLIYLTGCWFLSSCLEGQSREESHSHSSVRIKKIWKQDHSVRIKIVMIPLKMEEIHVCGQS